MLRRRSSSLFSLDDYETVKKINKQENSVKGAFKVVHSDRPAGVNHNVAKHGSLATNILLSSLREDKVNNKSPEPNVSQLNKNKLAANLDEEEIEKPTNTYELEPLHPVNLEAVRKIIQDELQNVSNEKTLKNMRCKKIVEGVKTRLKMLSFDRYRFVVTATCFDKTDQTVRCASRCFWDESRDTFVEESFQNKDFVISCVIYAVYLD